MLKRLQEINTRMAELRSQLEGDGEVDLKAIEAEIRSLSEEKAQIENRRALANSIAAGETPAQVVATPAATPAVTEDRESVLASAEYRSIWLKSIRKLPLSDAEKRAAMTTGAASAGAAVPTVTVNKIIEKLTQYCPFLEKIELLKVPGGIAIPKEGTTNDAALHTEGATITSSSDTLGKITLDSYEITKLVTISKSVEKMAIDAFENWLVKRLAKSIADKITNYILFGTGSSQPEGIDSITWSATNSITVAVNADLDEDDVEGAVALLGGGYDDGAEWVMSRKTFFSDFKPLMNIGKNNLVTREGGKYYVDGYPVSYDSRVLDHEAYLCNLEEGYVGNMPEDITVTSEFVVRENSYDFLGCAMFDGAIKATEAFVKIIKATS